MPTAFCLSFYIHHPPPNASSLIKMCLNVDVHTLRTHLFFKVFFTKSWREVWSFLVCAGKWWWGYLNYWTYFCTVADAPTATTQLYSVFAYFTHQCFYWWRRRWERSSRVLLPQSYNNFLILLTIDRIDVHCIHVYGSNKKQNISYSYFLE